MCTLNKHLRTALIVLSIVLIAFVVFIIWSSSPSFGYDLYNFFS